MLHCMIKTLWYVCCFNQQTSFSFSMSLIESIVFIFCVSLVYYKNLLFSNLSRKYCCHFSGTFSAF